MWMADYISIKKKKKKEPLIALLTKACALAQQGAILFFLFYIFFILVSIIIWPFLQKRRDREVHFYPGKGRPRVWGQEGEADTDFSSCYFTLNVLIKLAEWQKYGSDSAVEVHTVVSSEDCSLFMWSWRDYEGQPFPTTQVMSEKWSECFNMMMVN